MNAPTFDSDGYPTEETLNAIRTWPFTDHPGLMRFVQEAVAGYGSLRHAGGHKFALATGGWSGNESIVQALHENAIFMAACWESSHRGGLTIYKVPGFRL